MIDLSFMAGLPVAVLGLGKSGLAAARALIDSGAKVLAWDDAEQTRAAAGIPLTDLAAIDWTLPVALVLSPGIPLDFPKPHPIVLQARAAGVEVIGDIELLLRACRDAGYVGITGTNGKSTTTALIAHLLAASGRAVEVGGNLGTPALTLAPLGAGETYVLEMSSYQLDLTPSMAFDVSVLLNVSPDHLDRHGGMDGYIAAKRQIFRNQQRPKTAVVGVDDAITAGIADALDTEGGPAVIRISAERPVKGGISAVGGCLVDDLGEADLPVLDLRTVATLPGQHNWQNAAAAYAAVRTLGLAPPDIAAGMRSFPGLAHRQERVGTVDGVLFVNDSKATNADAAARALACYQPIYWIAGGVAKAGGIEPLAPFFPRIRRAFLIGEAAQDFARTLAGRVAFEQSGTLSSAVAQAYAAARQDGLPDSVVLLSPACASFDQYPNFEVRGAEFRRLVEAMPGMRGAA